MSGFSGINQFGSLYVNGQKLTFEDFDKDKNGEISQEEYNSVLKETNLDSVELATVDSDGNKTISEQEFAVWEQKIQMQDAVNEMSMTISKDFAGKTEALAELSAALKDYIDEYATNYTGDVAVMAEIFKATLPEKYEEFKQTILANDPSTIESSVIDEIYDEISKDENGNPLTGDLLARLGKEIEAEADRFVKNYQGNNLREDLKMHLQEYMKQSDAEKLSSAVEEYNTSLATLGSYLDNKNDLKALKEFAEIFLNAALEKGVTIKLEGTTIKTQAAITTALNKFSDSNELKAALDEVIANLDTETFINKIAAEEQENAENSAYQEFIGVQGEEYAIDPALIDYSKIDNYNAITITLGNKSIDEKCRPILNNDALKSQMKSQIETMLQEKGISFDKVATVFENVYNQTINETLQQDGISIKLGFSSIVKNDVLISAFITNFNTNIAEAINNMNASESDLNFQDIDYSLAVTDENGKVDEKLAEALNSGTPVTILTRRDEEDNTAEKMIDRLQSSILIKAKTMCEANGIDFDASVFSTMFNNAKLAALNSGGATDKKVLGGLLTIINPQMLIEEFIKNFQESYTAWVESEASEAEE